MGADYIELDVHASADGTPVVTHDPPTSKATLALADVAEALHGRIGLMVELKQPYRYRRHRIIEHTLALLDDTTDLLLSFEPAALHAAKSLRPAMRLVQHVGYGVSIHTAAGYAWGVGLDADRLTSTSIRTATKLGLVTTVYTVNDEPRMREFLALGVHGIYSDRPDLLRKVVTSS